VAKSEPLSQAARAQGESQKPDNAPTPFEVAILRFRSELARADLPSIVRVLSSVARGGLPAHTALAIERECGLRLIELSGTSERATKAAIDSANAFRVRFYDFGTCSIEIGGDA